jgi:ABC-type multidrug transport system ATPase subunit
LLTETRIIYLSENLILKWHEKLNIAAGEILSENSDQEIVIKTIDLTKRFKKVVAVEALNLEVYRGDVFGFLGPNGAGKSTTIRMLLGLVHPDRGQIELLGETFNSRRQKMLSRIGSLVETADFYPYLTARRNLKLLKNLSGGVGEERIEKVLDLVGLQDRGGSRVKTLSHGMRQRLGIAQALLTEPEIMILDEPTAGLDPKGMKEVRELIRKLSAARKITIFLSSHLLFEIEQVATRMAIIDRGKLITQGGVKQLLSTDDKAVVVVDRPQEAAALLESSFQDLSLEIVEGRLQIDISREKLAEINSFLVQTGFNVSALIPKRSLEDFFLSLTER